MHCQEVLARCIPVSREVFSNHLDRFAARLMDHPVSEERDGLCEGVYRATVLPNTSPDFVLKTAYSRGDKPNRGGNPW